LEKKSGITIIEKAILFVMSLERLMSGITLSALEEDILTLLKGKKSYGMEIMEAVFEISSGERFAVSGTFYPIFKKLEINGLIISDWGDSSPGARRKYYQLTDKGLQALFEKHSYRTRLSKWKPRQEASAKLL
jgi:PadR family transcriptional regulator, regulatory protein PadR